MLSDVGVSAGIVTYNNIEKLPKAVESILEHTKKYPLTLTVYDNASSDGTVEYVKNLSGVRFISSNGNLGFGKAHNLALDDFLGKYHAVINPDIYIEYDVISELVDFLEQNEDVVMVTPKILQHDGSIQHLPKKRPTLKYLFFGRLSKLGGYFKKIRDEYTIADISQEEPSDIEFCTGCFFIIRSDVFKKLGGFDENFFMYMEDADLTRRAKAFGRVVYYPKASLYHFWARKSAKNLKYLFIHLKSSIYYFRKWHKDKLKPSDDELGGKQ